MLENNHKKRRMNKYIEKIEVLFLCIILFFVYLPISVKATDNPKKPVYKVGVFGFDNFLSVNENGIGSGYAGEYLERIAEKENISFEYVNIPFEEANEAFKSGDFDVYAGIPYNQLFEENFDYSEMSMGQNYLELFGLSDSNTYALNDFESFSGMKVGYLSDSKKHIEAIEMIKNNNPRIVFVPYENITYDEYEDKLKSGEVNAIVGTTYKYKENYTVIARLSKELLFFGTQKDKPELKKYIDDGMREIDIEDSSYQYEIFQKYYGRMALSNLFTKEEREYISENPDINVYYSSDRGYLTEIRDGKYVGIEEDFVNEVAEIAGFNVNIIEVPDGESPVQYAIDGKINLFPGFTYSKDWSAETMISCSSPYLMVHHYMISKKNIDNDKIKSIAVIKGTNLTKEYILKKYSEDKVVYYETAEECMNAVEDGDVDVTFVSNYVAQYYLKQYEYRDLSMSFIEYSYELCFGVPKNCDRIFTQILSKSIEQISDNRRQELVLSNTSYIDGKVTWKNIIYGNPILCFKIVFIIIVLAFLVITTVIIIIMKNKQKKRLTMALKAAKQASDAKKDFLAGVSHDLRTPLNAILGFNKIARSEPGLSNEVDEYLKKVENSGKYMLSLINDVLDMSKIESGKIDLELKIVDGTKFLEEIREIYFERAREKGIKLETDFTEAKSQWIMMDPLRSRQIYCNLLSNAIKYSASGTTVHWKVKDKVVDKTHINMTCEISDEGCGMSEEFRKRLFKPFEQEENVHSNEVEGTGLGLSIVKKLVDLMNGTIEVKSVINVGTTFTITIERETVETYNEIEDKNNMISYDILKGKKILLCEDHPLNIQIAKKLLEKENIIVEVVQNGKEALDIFNNSEENYFDAILMDIRMPIMDGLEATKQLRALNREDIKRIPIIAMTANAFDEDVKECIAAGMDAHIAKPVDSEILYRTLSTLIRKKQNNM